MSIRISIDQDLKDLAVAHGTERMQFEYNRFGLSNDKRKSMVIIGTIGQLVFKKYLDDQHIAYDFEFQAGNYDELDFEINNEIYEIKTSGYDNSFSFLNLVYAQDQFDRGMWKNYKYCVQIFINGYSMATKMLDINRCNEAYIAGFIEFPEISNFKVERQAFNIDYKVPISRLKNLNELLIR